MAAEEANKNGGQGAGSGAVDSPAPGSTLEISIEKMVYGGDGLARTPEGVVLVAGVLPGERVTVRLAPPRGGVRRGHLAHITEASPERIAPDCPYFGRCGGCQYQHIRYERQLQLKQGIFLESLERIGKMRLEKPMTMLSGQPWHYRNRSRLQFEKQSSSFQAGYLEPFSHRLCPVEQCPISSPAINEALAGLAHGAGTACFPEATGEIEWFASDSDQALIATVHSSAAPPAEFGDRLMEALPGLQSVSWREQLSRRVTTWGSESLSYRVGEFHYRISHDSFFQTNRFLLPEMIPAVVGDLEGNWALDLYAGVGFFTIPLARRFERVVAVETDAPSARDLASNVGVVGGRARADRKTVENFLATNSRPWDAVVVNPPRSGLNRMVVEPLCRLRPPRLVYVSCDPTTLARDLAALTHDAYQIRSVHLVDQFPQTFHLESIVHLEKVG